jgi:LAO/AO transport system ATPase
VTSDDLLDRFRKGDRHALARLLTLAARGDSLAARGFALGDSKPRPARTIAFTGSAGVGKSTLIGKLIEHIRAQNQTVAVLACDPQSPLTGGALLGDRFRMPTRPDDAGVFIRSLAAASGQGAVAEHLDAMIDLLKAFGFDWILLETVGAGQGDTAVRDLADVVVLLLQPEAGDDIQWEKAGLLEIADVVVIQKADLPGADRVEAQVRAMLHLGAGQEVPILRVSAAKGEGIAELHRFLADRPPRPATQRDAARFEAMIQRHIAGQLRGNAKHFTDVRARWQRGELGDAEAAAAVLATLVDSSTQPW